MNVTVLVPAAGSGTRMAGAGEGSTKKQFLLLDGRPILAHTLSRFEAVPEVKEIIPIVPEDELEHCLERCVDNQDFRKVKRVIPGGVTRQDSVYNGLKAADPASDLILVHDGVRPFVTRELIATLLRSVDGCDGAILAVPAKDTLKEVTKGKVVKRTLDRRKCYMVQTPQAFRYDTLMKAFVDAYAEGFQGTDEAMLVERMGGRVKVVDGSYINIKITTPEDLILAETILLKTAKESVTKPWAGPPR